MLLTGLSPPSDHDLLKHRNMSDLSLSAQSSVHGWAFHGDIWSLETDILENGRVGRVLCIIVQQLIGLESLWTSVHSCACLCRT